MQPKQTLNPFDVPEALRPLIPYAERWGIPDDGLREDAIRAASREQLQALVDAVSAFSEDDFDDWLAGDEAKGSTFSRAYVAFTELRDAFEAAQWRLRNWGD